MLSIDVLSHHDTVLFRSGSFNFNHFLLIRFLSYLIVTLCNVHFSATFRTSPFLLGRKTLQPKSFFNKLSLVILKCFKNVLTEEDLWDLDEEHKTGILSPKFWVSWKKNGRLERLGWSNKAAAIIPRPPPPPPPLRLRATLSSISRK